METQIELIKNMDVGVQRLDNSRHAARKMYRSSELPIQQMLRAGLGREPLLTNVLKCIECALLQDLKYKAVSLISPQSNLLYLS